MNLKNLKKWLDNEEFEKMEGKWKKEGTLNLK